MGKQKKTRGKYSLTKDEAKAIVKKGVTGPLTTDGSDLVEGLRKDREERLRETTEEDGSMNPVDYSDALKGITKLPRSLGKGLEKVGIAKEVAEVKIPAKRELTDKELALRERDIAPYMKGDVSSVIPKGVLEQVNKTRRENWVAPSDVEKMPQWSPVIRPVVDKVIGEQVKDVKVYMETIARSERSAVVAKLAKLAHKYLPEKDLSLVELVTERALFDLLRDQGVGNLDKVKQILK